MWWPGVVIGKAVVWCAAGIKLKSHAANLKDDATASASASSNGEPLVRLLFHFTLISIFTHLHFRT
jgi:hypothetical protein